MARLELRTRQVGPWGMNTYALICPETTESILIDPGADPDVLLQMLGGSKPTAIVLTHTHIDHVGALPEMRAELNVPVMGHGGAHAGDAKFTYDRELQHGDTIDVGNHRIVALHAPGHIDDQVCLRIEDDNRVIVGDTIFEGGPGRTWNSDGFRQTLRTLREIVLSWPDDTVCYPGHGDAFRLGDIREQVEAFVAHDHGDFFGDAEWSQV